MGGTRRGVHGGQEGVHGGGRNMWCMHPYTRGMVGAPLYSGVLRPTALACHRASTGLHTPYISKPLTWACAPTPQNPVTPKPPEP